MNANRELDALAARYAEAEADEIVYEIYPALHAEARRLAAQVEKVRAVVNLWVERLSGHQCPSCLAPLAGPYSGCDHEEGYHHALSDMLNALDLQDGDQ